MRVPSPATPQNQRTQETDRRASRRIWTAFTVRASAAVGLFFVPAFIIRPFRYQAPHALLVAMALRQRQPGSGLVHHSDRGSTYASEDYRKVLEAGSIECSMSRKGDCWDNAVAESFFASLKRELDIDDFESWEAANLSIGEYIEGFYNPCRRHSALNYNSPIEFELIHSVKKAA